MQRFFPALAAIDLTTAEPRAAAPQAAHKSPSAPSDAKVLPLRGADCSALRRTISFMGGGAPKKVAGKNEKYINAQLATVGLDFKEP